MNLAQITWLQTEAGTAALTTLLAAGGITPANHLAVVTRLRETLSAEQAQAVVELTLLREKGAAKFSRANDLFFSREALEQATPEPVARFRTARYAALGAERIADLCCSIGGDALFLAQIPTVQQIIGVDYDPVRLALATANMRVYGLTERFQPLEADLDQLPPFAADAIFFDPARRTAAGNRLFSLYQYRPSFALVDRWRSTIPHIGVKVSPGVDYAEIPADAEVEFVSWKGGLKEAVLWFGGLHSGPARRATLLPQEVTMHSNMPEHDEVGPPAAYLYEPDPAVIRAGLVTQLALQLNAHKLAPDIAYLTSDSYIETPFARCFKIEDHFRFQLKRLRRYLRERDVGQVVIKKRGIAIDPDQLRQQLRLKGGAAQMLLIITRTAEGPLVLVGEAL